MSACAKLTSILLSITVDYFSNARENIVASIAARQRHLHKGVQVVLVRLLVAHTAEPANACADAEAAGQPAENACERRM